MGFRFRRTLRLAPGIRVNLSKTGASLSLGRLGATLNFSGWGTKATVGLPGSGLGYSTMLHPGPPTALPRDDEMRGLNSSGFIVVAIVVLIIVLFVLWS